MKLEAGEPNDLPVLLTAVPNWNVDESCLLGNGERSRILPIETEISEAPVDQGINAIWTVREAE